MLIPKRLVSLRATKNTTELQRHDAERTLQVAIRDANLQCALSKDRQACAVAWDIVDEIQRGIHQRRERIETDPLVQYCSLNPDGDECREYDV